MTSRLLERARTEPDSETLVLALGAHAWALHGLLDNAAAKRLLDEAVRVATREGLEHRLGQTLVTRAIALQELGRFAQARRDLDRAEGLLTGAQRADVVHQRAILDHNAGRAAQAVERYREVLAEPECDPVTWIKAANNLSNALTQLGRSREALRYLEQAADIVTEHGTWLVAIVASSRAWSTFHAGRIVESLRLFEEAGGLYRAADAPIGEHYLEYADALVDLRLLDEAATVARLAADELTRHDAPLMAAEARLRCSRLALAIGDVATASRDASLAVTDLRRQRRAAWVARATVAAVEAETVASGPAADGLRRLSRAAATLQRLGLGAAAVEAHLAAGRAAVALRRPGAARRHLRAAGDLSHGQSLLVRLRGHLALALLAEATGDPPAAAAQCGAGLQDLTRHRSALPSVELRILTSGHGAELGVIGLRALLPAVSASRVFTWLERTRAVSLLFAEPVPEVVDEDLAVLRSVEQQLRTARREEGAEPSGLVARQRALERRIRRRTWSGRVAGESPGAVVSPAALRRQLDGAWLVEFAALDARLLAVVVDPRRTRLVELGPVATVAETAQALRFGLRAVLRGGRFGGRARFAAQSALTALADRLVAPLGVPDDVPLVVVPCAGLESVLWPGLRRAPTSVAASASLWVRSRGAAPPPRTEVGSTVVAAIAGPGLPGAATEASAVGERHPGARVLLPPASTADAAVSALTGADLAHLACHGRLRSDSPLFSALELSDGSLTLHELLQRGIAPRRVVLAVCDSGIERAYDGGEVLGFVSALMAQGTAAVVASGMELPDGASVSLMLDLHRHAAAGVALESALHRSRAACNRDDPATFVAWCALTAYGAA